MYVGNFRTFAAFFGVRYKCRTDYLGKITAKQPIGKWSSGQKYNRLLLFIQTTMANDRQQFVFRREWYETISSLDANSRWEVLDMIMDFVFNDGLSDFSYSQVAKVVFGIIKPKIVEQIEKQDALLVKRRESGRLGGIAKAENSVASAKQVLPSANHVLQDATQTPTETPEKPKRTVFKKPTIEEIRALIAEKGYHFDAELFFAFYESKGWKIGNQPMKSWQAACVTWEKKHKNDAAQQPQQQKPKNPNDPDELGEYYRILKENQEREKARSADEDKRAEQRVIILNYMSAHKADYLDLKIGEVRENEYFNVTGLKDGTQYWVCKVGNCKRRFYMDYRTNTIEECKVSAPFRPNNDFVWDRDNNQWVEGY